MTRATNWNTSRNTARQRGRNWVRGAGMVVIYRIKPAAGQGDTSALRLEALGTPTLNEAEMFPSPSDGRTSPPGWQGR